MSGADRPRLGERETLPGSSDAEAATLLGDASESATMPGLGERTAPGRGRSEIEHPEPRPGDSVGRFVVERRLGAGAMGVVLLAHDPDLARPVAIKLVRVRGAGTHGRVRLLREAQSVAKIQHPHVIAVHEVGTHDDQVYVVMEYVDGGTLRDWVQAEPRAWTDVLEVYRQAGRGLVAAHRAGLVHRDFKPDNVLIGRDGRVRVTDFGIVGVLGEGPQASTLDEEVSIDHGSARLTRTGAIVGTPAYMPPEQYRSGSVDARSDQFAFCVSLYEALFGERPFEGDTIGSVLLSMQSGAVRPVTEHDVPDAVVEALFRGLRSEPHERHPTMDALLDALDPAPARPRWPWAVAGVGVLAVGAVAYALGGAGESDSMAAFDCGDARADFEPTWNDERRAAMKAAFEARGGAGPDGFQRVAEALDARRAEWIAGVDAACEDRRSGLHPAATYELRRACLEDARQATDTFVSILSESEGRLVDGALSSVSLLRRIDRCSNTEVLQAATWPTDAQREALAPIERDLAKARLMLLAGQHHEVVAFATDLEVRARAVGFDAVHAAVLETLARGEMQAGLLAQAETHAREASTLAAQARETSVEARAAGTLMFVIGPGLGRAAEALGMLPAGESAAARTHDPRARSYFKAAEAVVRNQNGDREGAAAAIDEVITILEGLERPPPDELANAYSNRSGLAAARGELQAARADQRKALDIAAQGLGTSHPMYGAFALALGASLANEGAYAEAIEHDMEALRAWEAALGRNHTSCALALNYAGIAQLAMGRVDDAGESFDEALRRLDASENDDPVNRISILDNQAQVAFRNGRFADAESGYAAAREVARALGGAKDLRVSRYDQAVASMHQARGDDEGALAGYRKAHDFLVEVHGPKHQQVAAAAAFVADSLRALGRCTEAGRVYRDALRIYNDLSLDPDAVLAQLMTGQGQCELEGGETEAAETTLERAADLLEQLKLEGEAAAMVQFAVARGRWARGEKDSAASLSAQAEAAYADLGPGWTRPRQDVHAWRAERGLAG